MDTPSYFGTMRLDDDGEIDWALPAILIGAVVDQRAEDVLRRLEEAPPWLAFFEHQHGGLATLQVTLFGALAPLAHAPARSEQRSTVIDGLDALACATPHQKEIRAYPELRPLHLSWGHPYGPPEIGALAAFLAKAFDLPPIERGHEAFVEHATCDLLRYFGGWPVLAREIPAASHLADPDAHHLVLGPRAVRRERQLDRRLITAIETTGQSLGLEGPPGAFLLWVNSD